MVWASTAVVKGLVEASEMRLSYELVKRDLNALSQGSDPTTLESARSQGLWSKTAAHLEMRVEGAYREKDDVTAGSAINRHSSAVEFDGRGTRDF